MYRRRNVADEIILSWKFRDAKANNRCIACFFAMKNSLLEREAWFSEKFGLVPTFKAGIHFGKITTGEIGAIKKEILFSGDVLNTTARIQGLCNNYNADLLVSDGLIRRLDLDPKLKIKSLGQNELKGRKENLELFTIFYQGFPIKEKFTGRSYRS